LAPWSTALDSDQPWLSREAITVGVLVQIPVLILEMLLLPEETKTTTTKQTT